MAIPEYRYGRDAADSELCSCLLRNFGIEFCKADPWFQLRGCVFKVRSHHLAGSAPGRPEIDHQRDVITAQMFCKALICQFYRLTDK